MGCVCGPLGEGFDLPPLVKSSALKQPPFILPAKKHSL